MSADDPEIVRLEEYLRIMKRDYARPVDTQVMVDPPPATWSKSEKVVERLQMFGPMNIYPNQGYLHCFCQSAQMAAEMIATRRIVVEGETYHLCAVKR